jgi:hypothetical protein
MSLWLSFALAGPLVPIQGVLVDGGGAPLQGTAAVEFALWEAATGGSPVHTEPLTVDAQGGAFGAALGSAVSFTDTFFRDHPTLWLSVTVAGVSSERVRVGTAPFAAYAVHAGDSAKLGGVDADGYLQVGDPITWSQLGTAGMPAHVANGYSAGAGLALSGTSFSLDPARQWTVGSGLSLTGATLSANGYTAGTGLTLTGSAFALDPARQWTVGAGLALTGTVLSVGGGGVAGALNGASIDVAAVEADNATIVGGLKLGAVGEAACNTAAAGTVRWNNTTKSVDVCDGTGWVSLSPNPDGTQASRPGLNCRALLQAGYSRGDGRYWIDPDGGNTSNAFLAFCDMTRQSGGWTLLLSANGDSTYWGNNSPNWWSASSDTNVPTALGNADHHSAAYSALVHNETRLCYGDATKCYVFAHNRNRTLRSFFTDNITHTEYSENSAGYANVGTNAIRSSYLSSLGFTIHTTSCWWLGINDQRSISAIGLLGDFNGGCTSTGGGGFHDDLAVGVGVSNCFDNNSCPNGGSGHKAGSTRGANGVDASGVFGPWFVFGR